MESDYRRSVAVDPESRSKIGDPEQQVWRTVQPAVAADGQSLREQFTSRRAAAMLR
jgi:hypothetical protein